MRRVIFYLVYDPRGQIDDYVIHKLKALRKHAEHIFVVSNCALQPEGRAKLEGVAETVWERENIGYDVWAYKEAMEHMGAARLRDFDELILMNYTFFGPINSFDELFADMDADTSIDFWGVTEHAEVVPHEGAATRLFAAHIQSHWIAVRSSMFTSPAFEAYWSEMPMITSYRDSIDRHEARFTQHFDDEGFTHRVAFPESQYPSRHPIMDDTLMMLRDGCPIVKRRTFFHDPFYSERHGIVGRDILAAVESAGYPVDMILSNLARTSVPRDLATNLSLLEVLPAQDMGYDPTRPMRTAAVAHVFYVDMTLELIERFAMMPGELDYIITTPDAQRKEAIEAILDEAGVAADVRVVESNRGRDISAFFIGCRDVIESDRYDLVIKLHTKRSPQDNPHVSELFKRHLFDNLLASAGHAANVARLFQRYPSLGIVLPPVVHLGYPTLGHAWFTNREPALEQAARLGIDVPFDQSTPLATYGSMFIARPAALRPIARGQYDYDEFPGEGGYSDGTLAHVLERLVVYGALSEGFHARQILSAEMAAINYSMLEYRLQAVSHLMPGPAHLQVPYLRRMRREAKVGRRLRRKVASPSYALTRVESLPPLTVIKATVKRSYPRVTGVARFPYRLARRLRRITARVTAAGKTSRRSPTTPSQEQP